MRGIFHHFSFTLHDGTKKGMRNEMKWSIFNYDHFDLSKHVPRGISGSN